MLPNPVRSWLSFSRVSLAIVCSLVFACGCETGPDGDEADDTVDRTANRPIDVDQGDATDDTPDNDPDLENTARNERDAEGETVTPFDQSNDPEDIALVADIREAVLEIEDLTLNGQNVKIITSDGNVVLRGPVHSEEERQAIVAAAQEIAGTANVTDQLEVDAEDEDEL